MGNSLRLTQQSCRFHRGAETSPVFTSTACLCQDQTPIHDRFTGSPEHAAAQCRRDAGIKYGIYFLQHIYIVNRPWGLYCRCLYNHTDELVSKFCHLLAGLSAGRLVEFLFSRCNLCGTSAANLDIQTCSRPNFRFFERKADDAGVLHEQCAAYAEACRNCRMYCAVQG